MFLFIFYEKDGSGVLFLLFSIFVYFLVDYYSMFLCSSNTFIDCGTYLFILYTSLCHSCNYCKWFFVDIICDIAGVSSCGQRDVWECALSGTVSQLLAQYWAPAHWVSVWQIWNPCRCASWNQSHGGCYLWTTTSNYLSLTMTVLL